MRTQATFIALTLSLALASGCPEEEDPPPVHQHGDCDDGGPVDEYVAGISRDTAAGLYTVAIVSADPAPPDVAFNDWNLRVTHADGTPLADGDRVRVRPWMPLHGHGTTPARYTADPIDGGPREVRGMDIMMPGLWEFYVEVEAAPGPDEVLFRFCVEG